MTAPGSRVESIKRIKDIFVSLMWVAHRHFSQWVQSYGLTHPQFFTLVSLAAHKQACTMRDLTSVTFQDPPTMTGIIDRLVKMKLVERTRSQTDRRVVLVQATPAGIDLVNKIRDEAIQDDLRTYATLSDDELRAHEDSLRYLLRMHVGRYMSLTGPQLDAEIERLQDFRRDPILYLKGEREKPI